jgi:hypothetical protein
VGICPFYGTHMCTPAACTPYWTPDLRCNQAKLTHLNGKLLPERARGTGYVNHPEKAERGLLGHKVRYDVNVGKIH